MGGEPTPTIATGPVRMAAVVVASAAAVLMALSGALDQASVGWWVGAAVVAAWAASAVVVTRRLPDLGLGLGAVAVGTGAAVAAGARFLSEPGDAAAWARAVTLALVPAAAVVLAVGLPGGRPASRSRRVLAAASILVGVGVGLAVGPAEELPLGPYVAETVVAATLAVGAYLRRCRLAGALDRSRLQWQGWGVVVAATFSAVVAVLGWLVDVPASPGLWALAATAVVPAAIVASTVPALLRVVDRVLVETTVVVGLLAVVGAVYLLVVVGLGQVPEDTERSVLLLSMVAAGVSAVLAFPARRRLERIANERIYGEREPPEEVLRGFAGRMTRALPMDELLLQLVETLRPTLHLAAAEVWTGANGVLERAAALPDRGSARLELSNEELTVVARSRVQGNAWCQVWLPRLSEVAGERRLRVAAMAHQGELLGLVVAEREPDDAEFGEDEDQVLADLARQVGLALHNVRLDSALQASLEQLQHRNLELQASRRRIVTAGDESRRAIERNLHDGAQQHLVAMAVKLGLARQVIDDDPATATGLLEELRTDVQDTLAELRELAHGIFPPLLRDRGLAEALGAAANRSPLPVDLELGVLDRFVPEAEAAIYFCCLEALQNAGKYAGDGARVRLTVSGDDERLRFEVADDGPGFDPGAVGAGHGFENMRDRLGAIGGELVVDAAPGRGARVGGWIPVEHVSSDAPPTPPG